MRRSTVTATFTDSLATVRNISVCELSSEGRILRANRDFSELTGRAEQSLVGVEWVELVHPSDAARAVAHLSACLRNEVPVEELEYRYMLSAGRSVWVRSAFAQLRCCAGSIASDTIIILTQLLTQQADFDHAPTQDALPVDTVHELLDRTQEAVFELDSEFRYTYVNAAGASFLLRDPSHMLGQLCWDVSPYVDDLFVRNVRRAMRERVELAWESSSSITGSWMHWRAVPLVGGLALFVQSIDEQRRAEQAMRESERRFAAVTALVPAVIWTSDAQGKTLWRNQAWLDFSGQTLSEALNAPMGHSIHPEDRPRSIELYTAALAMRQPFSTEHRLRRHDGEYRWFLARARPIVDDDGVVTHWVGAAVDVQAQRDALESERAARWEAEQVRDHYRRVLTQVPIALTVFRGPDHVVEVVTAVADAIYGRDVTGCTAREAMPEAAVQSGRLDQLDRVYRTGEAIDCSEVQGRVPRDDGAAYEERIFDLRWTALKSGAGEVYGVIGSGLDVTTQVRARNALEAARLEEQRARAIAELERERLSSVLSRAPFGVAITAGPVHALRNANAKLVQLLGAGAVLNQPFGDALPHTEGVMDALDQAYSTGRVIVAREQRIDRSTETGTEYFDLIVQPMRIGGETNDGLLVFVTDVSESVKARLAVTRARDESETARAAAEAAHERLDSILAAIPTAVVVTRGEQHTYELVNPAYSRMVGGRDVLGHAVLDVFPEIAGSQWMQTMDSVLHTGASVLIPEMPATYDRDGNGTLYHGHFSSFYAPVKDRTGCVVGVVSSALDVTEQVLQRERIEALRKEAEAARLDLQIAQLDLEERIARRTSELAALNQALADEIVIRKEAEANRQELLRRLATAREEEQRRTSRDLHDQVGQTLSALTLAIKAACDAEPLSSSAMVRLSDAMRIAEGLGRDIHNIATRLRPSALDEFGLLAALRQLVSEFSRHNATSVDLQAGWLSRVRISADLETLLYRIVQEALTNIARHAKASRVSVVVGRHDGHVTAVVEDDGVGFDASAIDTERLGLQGMIERVTLAGGTLEIESAQGVGTTILVRVPLRPSVRNSDV